MSNAVVFLDIDGVLNSGRFLRDRHMLKPTKEELVVLDRLSKRTTEHDFFQLDPTAIVLLNEIELAVHPVWVLSSTWRLYHPINDLNVIFSYMGFLGKLSDKTPEEPAGRGWQIDAWLEDHPEIEHLVIIDDDADMEPWMDQLVRTNFKRGITKRHIPKILEILSKKVYREST